MPSTERGAPFARRFGVTLLAGVHGVLALVAYVYLTTLPSAVPAGPTLPRLAIVSGITPLSLLAVACPVRAYAALRTGLRSCLLDRVSTGERVWSRLREEVGLAGLVSVVGLDVLLAPYVCVDLPASAIGGTRSTVFEVLVFAPVRFLYGGVTEELLLRFGLMSALVLAGWYLTGRAPECAGSRVTSSAILLLGVVFGLGHLPALAQPVGLTPALVARTVLLNAIAGSSSAGSTGVEASRLRWSLTSRPRPTARALARAGRPALTYLPQSRRDSRTPPPLTGHRPAPPVRTVWGRPCHSPTYF